MGREPWFPPLGVEATVVMDRETHGPRTARGERYDLTEIEGDAFDGELVSDFRIVSVWTLHVALYGLQNPTSQNIDRALELIGVSGDVEEWTDSDTLRPLPVEVPDGWRRSEHENSQENP